MKTRRAPSRHGRDARVYGHTTTAMHKLSTPSPPPPPPLWSDHTKKQSNSLVLLSISKKVGTRCRSPSYERSLERCSSPFMRLAEHLTALRAWCKQCLSGWSKPDVLRPDIVRMQGSMVIRLRPLLVTDIEYTPPPPPLPI